MQEASPDGLYDSLSLKAFPCVNTRFELLGRLGKLYFKDHANALSTVFGDYVLISDSFAPKQFQTIGAPKIEPWVYKQISELSLSETEKKRLVKVRDESFTKKISSAKAFANAVNHVVSTNPNINFVFRPHPLAALEFWSSHLNQSRNLSIVYKGSVEPWLHAAQAVIHSSCTTGLQA